jgi:16S rRNA C967 or C1407 C5-methylase (RsmB/RsmF family)
MCAAPGSKTSQILEIISEIPNKTGALEPVGCVVANDADPKRAYMLVHQLKRIHSPVALVTSCDAQFFPLLKNFGD